MKKKYRTFSTARAWLCLRLLILWSLAMVPSSLRAQISPGDLTWAHESIDGLTTCTKCHQLGEGPSAKKCLTCHTGIQSRLEQKLGYHHTLVTIQKKACFSCHSEHAGREFKLIVWPDGQESFDHELTGFNLTGKHAKTNCRDCHNPANLDSKLKEHDLTVDLTRTFLGLGQDCLSCHKDEHRGQLLADCQRCHTGKSWKPATGFNHEFAAFKLTGQHRDLKCGKCHTSLKDKNAPRTLRKTYYKFTGLSFNDCSSCHKDKHDNKFGPDCSNCHQTSGWNRVLTANFDHSKTRFKQVGKHKELKCKKCHTAESKLVALKFEQCGSCHSDYHRGQFARREDKGKCESCHNEHGFSPSLFTIADHQEARFTLTGAHLAQPCLFCHKSITDDFGKEFVNFTIEERNCQNCHQENHGGQFADSKPVKQCVNCHAQEAWLPVSFDHDRDCSYPLQGAHKKASCEGCHKKLVATNNGLVTQYRSVDKKCESCHTSSTNLTDLN